MCGGVKTAGAHLFLLPFLGTFGPLSLLTWVCCGKVESVCHPSLSATLCSVVSLSEHICAHCDTQGITVLARTQLLVNGRQTLFRQMPFSSVYPWFHRGSDSLVGLGIRVVRMGPSLLQLGLYQSTRLLCIFPPSHWGVLPLLVNPVCSKAN